MNSKRATLVALVGLGIVIGTASQALGDQSDQKTVFTFKSPVEIPGQVLEPGTYVFKLADSESDRDLVQVFNKDETHLYGTFITIPDQRIRPAGRPIITFDERPADSPEAVRAWFYPGDVYGHDFVYPKPRAVALAKANNKPVPSMPAELAANTTKPTVSINEPHVLALRQAPLKAQKPTEEEVEIREVFVAEYSTPATLPKTASNLALIGILGMISLALASVLSLVRPRSN
jgi:hypothetical protein